MKYNTLYQSKIFALKDCIKMLQIDLSQILSEYGDECFYNSNIQKKRLFKNIMEELSFSQKEEDLMNERCEGLTRFRDRRSGIEYATDLILGWISEDAIINYFNSNSLKADKYGTDHNREFLKAKNISAQSDIILSRDSNNRKIEYMNDWTGFWNRTNKLHLRDNKFLKIKDENAIFLGITPINQEAVVVETNNNDSTWKYIESHYPYGGKPAWELSNVKNFTWPIKEALDKIIFIVKK